ncbi:MAG: hypothetical protein ACI9NT_001733 [Bacteroidia bacterium]|jgi:hypothetical protein
MENEVIFAVIVFGAFLLSRLFFSSRADSSQSGDPDRRAHYSMSNPFHAVTIVPGQACCREIEQLQRESFLSDEAPSLPLSGCAAGSCECRYVHHTDRRDGSRDRRQPLAHLVEVWSLRDRRETSGRRQVDMQLA